MSQPVIVGLLGRAGSGKSTAASHLERVFGACRHSMAWPLKQLAREVFDFSEEQVFGTQAQKEAVDPRYGVSARECLIRLGEGARRWISPRVWADGCLTAILDAHAADGSILHVIEDVRHANEAQLIKRDTRVRGYVLKLEYGDRASSAAFNEAPSEVSVDNVPAAFIDVVIKHATSRDASDLKRQVEAAVMALAGPLLVKM